MPYYHCRKCQHEFEYIPYSHEEPICDWCGADKPIILEEQTPLELMANSWGKVMEVLTEHANLRERKTRNVKSD